jgi:hypothetical protein
MVGREAMNASPTWTLSEIEREARWSVWAMFSLPPAFRVILSRSARFRRSTTTRVDQASCSPSMDPG